MTLITREGARRVDTCPPCSGNCNQGRECKTREQRAHKLVKDMTGQRFGRLVVLKWAGTDGNRSALWATRCDCGREKVVSRELLRSGKTRSCGCLAHESAVESGRKKRTHGMTDTSTYYIYQGIIQRCHNPKAPAYGEYGGRGITVCQRWLDSFESFLADMGERPEGLTLDRIDNDKGYGPDNCRWATWVEQANNRRSGVFVEHEGRRLSTAQRARELGMRQDTLMNRLKSGWSIVAALTTRVRPHRSKS